MRNMFSFSTMLPPISNVRMMLFPLEKCQNSHLNLVGTGELKSMKIETLFMALMERFSKSEST